LPSATILSRLRDAALSPALYADRVPRGVLYDVGLALWEMPPSAQGGGYMHALRVLDFAEYNRFLRPPLREAPTVATRTRLAELADLLFHSPVALLHPADFPTIYNSGSSLAVQNLVLAPLRTADGGFTTYRYDAEVTEIIALAGSRSLYANVGQANNSLFFTGEFSFNNRYPLVCRPADNVYRIAVEADEFGLAPDDYVHATDMVGVDMVTRLWPHTVYDPSHPDVVDLTLRSIGELVGTFGARLKYLLGGEAGLIQHVPDPFVDRRLCGQVPFTVLCTQCEPTTSYADRQIVGFRRWLQNVLHLSLAELNEEWGTHLESYAEIDPRTVQRCPQFPAAVERYAEFLGWLLAELGVHAYRHAKQIAPDAECSVLRFHAHGMEESWLASDFGSAGDWHGESDKLYLKEPVSHLQWAAAAARLSGVPAAFPISAPPPIPLDSPPNQEQYPPLFRSYRTYDRDVVHWFFRDLLTVGATHIGYLRCPGLSFVADPASVAAVTGGIAEIVATHDEAFAACGPWQRCAIHVEHLRYLLSPASRDRGARLAYWFGVRLHARHVPFALFESPRVRRRGPARWWLDHSFVLVPWPADIDAVRADYVASLPEGAEGAALLIADDGGAPPPWVDPAPLATISHGVLYRVRDQDARPTNCFLFAARLIPANTPLEPWLEGLATALDATIRPIVEAHIGAPAHRPFVPAPVVVTTTPGARIATNLISDGIGFTVAASNLGDGDATVTLSVDPRIGAAMGVDHPPQTFLLRPRETRFAVLAAAVPDVDVAAAVDVAEPRVADLGAEGFAVGHAAETIALARRLLAVGAHGRALAAIVAVHRMLLLRARHDAPHNAVEVFVRRIGLEGEPAALPVAGARVQILFPLNGREEQEEEAVTDATGRAVLAIGTPRTPRWSFAHNDAEPPPESARWLVEVHVTDPDTGAGAFALVRAFPPPID